ncbi:MAG: peptidase C39 family protein, partial [Nocardioides sp.]|nr:peptidase C39 family protein [Nocardioides sp.]
LTPPFTCRLLTLWPVWLTVLVMGMFRGVRFRVLAVAIMALVPALSTTPADAATRSIQYHRWTGPTLAQGIQHGTRVSGGALVLAHPTGTTKVGSATYEYASWTSPVVRPGFSLTELIPSWAARTPGRSTIRVDVRLATSQGDDWDEVARWSGDDTYVKRASYGTQSDYGSRLATDTEVASGGASSYQVRVLLMRPRGGSAVPSVRSIGAVASRLPSTAPATSTPSPTGLGRTLAVPRYSQMIHSGEYPQYGGGGRAWCSPTSVAMVLGYEHAGPPKAAYAWVKSSYRDRWVDQVARGVYDHAYEGAGNWPFNTAYAANRAGHAFVTRLANLNDVQAFIARGIPVVISIAFAKGGLTGAPISSTAGHLVVVVGFTAAGRPVVNDPAAKTDASVRHIYSRAQLERAWLKGSKGTAYIITKGQTLPPRGAVPRW